jgi:predicted outer membrane repeat protein
MRYSKPFAVVSNCTFAGNVAATYGGAVYMANLTTQSLNIVNSILWDNTAATGGVMYVNGSSATATVTFAYSDVDGGWNGAKVYKANGANVTITDLGGNTNVNPQFSPTLGGTWTSAEIRNPALGQTTLTDTGAIWTANALQGLTIQPNTASALQYLVASNTLTTVTVWGLVTSGGLTPYALRDARLCSTGGRWTPGDVWVKDNVHSPCIDAGDPQAAYWLEPPFNGSRINMGFDGNTAQASKSSPPGTVMTIR